MKNPSKAESFRYLLWHFSFDTDRLFDELEYEEKENLEKAKRARDRLKAYLIYTKNPLGASIYRHFLTSGYPDDFLNALSERYPCLLEPSPTEQLSRKELSSYILQYCLEDALTLFHQVLNDDEKDPEYSAVTTEKRLVAYLICKRAGGSPSVREFLQGLGYSKEIVDVFYEKFRRECPRWYLREPRRPIWAKGKLRVYEVEDRYVVGIRAVRDGNILDPKGAEFTAEREIEWTQNLSPVKLSDVQSLLKLTRKQLSEKLGAPHVLLTLRGKKQVLCFITERGYLIGFFFSDGKVTGYEMVDLLKKGDYPEAGYCIP